MSCDLNIGYYCITYRDFKFVEIFDCQRYKTILYIPKAFELILIHNYIQIL